MQKRHCCDTNDLFLFIFFSSHHSQNHCIRRRHSRIIHKTQFRSESFQILSVSILFFVTSPHLPPSIGSSVWTLIIYSWFPCLFSPMTIYSKDRKMALLQLSSVEEAVLALMKMHNYQLSDSNHLRVSFSKSNI